MLCNSLNPFLRNNCKRILWRLEVLASANFLHFGFFLWRSFLTAGCFRFLIVLFTADLRALLLLTIIKSFAVLRYAFLYMFISFKNKPQNIQQAHMNRRSFVL